MKKTQEPKYRTVEKWVLENIRSGAFKAGDKLPSEHELGVKFDLSRQTIRHAIDMLEQQSLIKRVKGSGTYIGGEKRCGRQEHYKNVAVISTYVDSYIFPPVLRGIERVLSREGYTTQIAFTGNKVDREQEILEKIIQKDMIDGLIVEPAKSALPNPNLHFYQKLMERNVPILFFNSFYPALALPCVALDDCAVGRQAVEYLIRAGHREIGGIFKCDDGQGHLRYTGFMEGARKGGVHIRTRNVVWLDTEMQHDLEEWPDYVLSRIKDCSAVVCYNDEVAYVLAGICQKRGIRIPKDLSMVSVDNSELSTMGPVSMTSFPHPMEALGKMTSENMIHMIQDPYFDGNYYFESQVVERDSVKKL